MSQASLKHLQIYKQKVKTNSLYLIQGVPYCSFFYPLPEQIHCILFREFHILVFSIPYQNKFTVSYLGSSIFQFSLSLTRINSQYLIKGVPYFSFFYPLPEQIHCILLREFHILVFSIPYQNKFTVSYLGSSIFQFSLSLTRINSQYLIKGVPYFSFFYPLPEQIHCILLREFHILVFSIPYQNKFTVSY